MTDSVINMERFNRTEKIIGSENLEKLKNSHIIVFGLGGVGGSLVETLVRSGVGKITIVDKDEVDITNLNRQIIATEDTIGMRKIDACYNRMKLINPEILIEKFDLNLDRDTINEFDFTKYDFIADAIDTVTSKILLAEYAAAANTPIIMSMGMGNKLDPTKIRVEKVEKTSICPLARVIRKEFKKRNIKNVPCVFSTEEAVKIGERAPASIAFVPPVAGIIMAGYIVRKIMED